MCPRKSVISSRTSRRLLSPSSRRRSASINRIGIPVRDYSFSGGLSQWAESPSSSPTPRRPWLSCGPVLLLALLWPVRILGSWPWLFSLRWPVRCFCSGWPYRDPSPTLSFAPRWAKPPKLITGRLLSPGLVVSCSDTAITIGHSLTASRSSVRRIARRSLGGLTGKSESRWRPLIRPFGVVCISRPRWRKRSPWSCAPRSQRSFRPAAPIQLARFTSTVLIW